MRRQIFVGLIGLIIAASLLSYVKQPDDMKTDPAGNSGDRIACGVISKGSETESQ